MLIMSEPLKNVLIIFITLLCFHINSTPQFLIPPFNRLDVSHKVRIHFIYVIIILCFLFILIHQVLLQTYPSEPLIFSHTSAELHHSETTSQILVRSHDLHELALHIKFHLGSRQPLLFPR